MHRQGIILTRIETRGPHPRQAEAVTTAASPHRLRDQHEMTTKVLVDLLKRTRNSSLPLWERFTVQTPFLTCLSDQNLRCELLLHLAQNLRARRQVVLVMPKSRQWDQTPQGPRRHERVFCIRQKSLNIQHLLILLLSLASTTLTTHLQTLRPLVFLPLAVRVMAVRRPARQDLNLDAILPTYRLWMV